MNIIDERNKRNVHRKRMKQEYDSVMKLSVTENDWVPLLSEGMITYSDGTPQFYIMRGTLRDFYDSLPADYEGSINIGHTDMATFPERIVGRWTKQNLRLTDAGDGRETLETNLPINMDHPLVQALSQAEFDVGLSVEMNVEVNEELTNNTELNPFGVPIVERLFVYDYAIVGNAGDVGSMGIHLKGGIDPDMSKRMQKLAALLENEGGSNMEAITKSLEAFLSEEVEETTEETEETSEEETEEETEETSEEETEEEEAEEETEEEAEEESEEETEEESSELGATLSTLIKEVTDLRVENAQLKAQLAAKNKQEKDFVDKFKQLSVSLTKEQKAKKTPKSQYTDGIGE